MVQTEFIDTALPLDKTPATTSFLLFIKGLDDNPRDNPPVSMRGRAVI
jgi:hypothetical protein